MTNEITTRFLNKVNELSGAKYILAELDRGVYKEQPQQAIQAILDVANHAGEEISRLGKENTDKARTNLKRWTKIVVRLRANPWFGGIYCREVLMRCPSDKKLDEHLADIISRDRCGIFTDVLLGTYHYTGELSGLVAVRAALYKSLEEAVNRRDTFAIRNLVKAFKKYYPNPDAEMQDPATALRAFTQRNKVGFTEIPMPFASLETAKVQTSSRQALLGSRPLIKPISQEEIAALQKLHPPVTENIATLQDTVKQVDAILKAKGYAGSPFFVTLWDIIRQGLEKKINDTNGHPSSLEVTIQSMQELSELFDAKGRPKKIAGLDFITNQREIDDFVEQITPYLQQLKLLEAADKNKKPLKVKLQRIPLYDHNTKDPKTGQVVNFQEYQAQIAALAGTSTRSETSQFTLAGSGEAQKLASNGLAPDVLYVHCYSGKERSVNVMIHLIIEEMSKQWTTYLGADSTDKQELNKFFLSPFDMSYHISGRRNIAKPLEKMSVAQQQVTFAYFFAVMNASRFPDKAQSEAAKNALALAFAAQGTERIAHSLYLCLHNFRERKKTYEEQGRISEFAQEEKDRNEVMFRVLRSSDISIHTVEKHYVACHMRNTPKFSFGAVLSWIKRQFTKKPAETEQSKHAIADFNKSFVPEIFLRFLQSTEGMEDLLNKQPAEIAKYLGCFLTSSKATDANLRSEQLRQFIRRLWLDNKIGSIFTSLDLTEKNKFSALLKLGFGDKFQFVPIDAASPSHDQNLEAQRQFLLGKQPGKQPAEPPQKNAPVVR